MKDSTYSFLTIFYSIKYVFSNRWTWKYILGLLFMNVLSFILAVFALYSYLESIVDRLLEHFNANSEALEVALTILGFVISAAVAILLFNLISSIVSAPIFSLFSDRLRYEDGLINRIDRFSIFKSIFYSISFEIKKLVIIFVFAIILLPLNLIPFVGQVLYVILNSLQIIVITGLDLLSPYIENEHPRFSQKVRFVYRNPTKLWPLLFVAGSLGVIPVVNLFTIPLAIVAIHLAYKRFFNAAT